MRFFANSDAPSHCRYYKVDDFTGNEDDHIGLFFCTHVHTDHLQGLKDGWDKGRIVTSSETAVMLKARFPSLASNLPTWQGGHSRLIALDINPDVGNTVFLDQDETIGLTVTLLDANHCPGSAMFYIQGSFGNRLHTGDFRYDAALHHPDQCPILCSLDEVYMDTTFLHPSWVFPTKSESTDLIVALLRQEAIDKQKKVILAVDMLGQEAILEDVHSAFGDTHGKIVLSLNACNQKRMNTNALTVWQDWLRDPLTQHAVEQAGICRKCSTCFSGQIHSPCSAQDLSSRACPMTSTVSICSVPAPSTSPAKNEVAVMTRKDKRRKKAMQLKIEVQNQGADPCLHGGDGATDACGNGWQEGRAAVAAGGAGRRSTGATTASQDRGGRERVAHGGEECMLEREEDKSSGEGDFQEQESESYTWDVPYISVCTFWRRKSKKKPRGKWTKNAVLVAEEKAVLQVDTEQALSGDKTTKTRKSPSKGLAEWKQYRDKVDRRGPWGEGDTTASEKIKAGDNMAGHDLGDCAVNRGGVQKQQQKASQCKETKKKRGKRQMLQAYKSRRNRDPRSLWIKDVRRYLEHHQMEAVFLRCTTLGFSMVDDSPGDEHRPGGLVRRHVNNLRYCGRGMWRVLYSMHSSFPELVAFYNAIIGNSPTATFYHALPGQPQHGQRIDPAIFQEPPDAIFVEECSRSVEHQVGDALRAKRLRKLNSNQVDGAAQQIGAAEEQEVEGIVGREPKEKTGKGFDTGWYLSLVPLTDSHDTAGSFGKADEGSCKGTSATGIDEVRKGGGSGDRAGEGEGGGARSCHTKNIEVGVSTRVSVGDSCIVISSDPSEAGTEGGEVLMLTGEGDEDIELPRCNGEDAMVDGEQAVKTIMPALEAPPMHESIAGVSMMRKREARQGFGGAGNTDGASSSCCNLPYPRTWSSPDFAAALDAQQAPVGQGGVRTGYPLIRCHARCLIKPPENGAVATGEDCGYEVRGKHNSRGDAVVREVLGRDGDAGGARALKMRRREAGVYRYSSKSGMLAQSARDLKVAGERE